MTTLVNQSGYAKHRGVSAMRISQLKREGKLVIVDGKVDVEATDAALGTVDANQAARARTRTPKKSGNGSPIPPTGAQDVLSYTAARTRKEDVATALLELDLKKKLGELVDADGVRRAMGERLPAAVKEFKRIPSLVAGRVAAESDPRKCEAIIDAAIDAACRQIAALGSSPMFSGETRQ